MLHSCVLAWYTNVKHSKYRLIRFVIIAGVPPYIHAVLQLRPQNDRREGLRIGYSIWKNYSSKLCVLLCLAHSVDKFWKVHMKPKHLGLVVGFGLFAMYDIPGDVVSSTTCAYQLMRWLFMIISVWLWFAFDGHYTQVIYWRYFKSCIPSLFPPFSCFAPVELLIHVQEPHHCTLLIECLHNIWCCVTFSSRYWASLGWYCRGKAKEQKRKKLSTTKLQTFWYVAIFVFYAESKYNIVSKHICFLVS